MTDIATCFWCEGCGFRTIQLAPRPAHGFCAICAWLNEYEPPERIMQLRQRCEPGGWESERQRRLMPPSLYDPN